MDQYWKQKWVKALRSGKYQQGRGYLKQKNHLTNQFEYCCLGVLCDLYDSKRWKEFDCKPSLYDDYFQYENESASIPQEIASKINLTKSVENNLMGMNDLSR